MPALRSENLKIITDFENMTQKQKEYAATDAWSCIMIYEELQRLKQTGDYELIEE